MNKFVLSTIFSVVCTMPALAAYVVDIELVGNDVVATGSGSIGLGGMAILPGSPPTLGPAIGDEFLTVGQTGLANVYRGAINFSGPTNVSTLADAVNATSGDGDIVGMATGGRFLVPNGYVSGDPLSGSATFADATLSSLGLSPGTSVWTWSISATDSDSFTLNVVPEPTALLLFFLSLGGCAILRRVR